MRFFEFTFATPTITFPHDPHLEAAKCISIQTTSRCAQHATRGSRFLLPTRQTRLHQRFPRHPVCTIASCTFCRFRAGKSPPDRRLPQCIPRRRRLYNRLLHFLQILCSSLIQPFVKGLIAVPREGFHPIFPYGTPTEAAGECCFCFLCEMQRFDELVICHAAT